MVVLAQQMAVLAAVLAQAELVELTGNADATALSGDANGGAGGVQQAALQLAEVSPMVLLQVALVALGSKRQC